MSISTPSLKDPVARALWHLELGYPEADDDQAQDLRGDDDFDEPNTCWNCGGEGFVIVCCDDLCHGQGYCMYGDGNRTCHVCAGEGAL